MGNKRERHQAKVAKRAVAKTSNDAANFMPKPLIGSALIPARQPAARVENEIPSESHVRFYGALSALKNRSGNGESFCLLYSRLAFGRFAAMRYFNDEAAEDIHYAIGNMIIKMDSQPEGQAMFLDPERCIEIHQCLENIEDMAFLMSNAEYDTIAAETLNLLNNVPMSAGEYNLVDWDEFKARESSKNQVAALVADRRYK